MNGLVNVHLNDLVNVRLSNLVNVHLNVYLIAQLNVHLNGHDDTKACSNTRHNTPQYVALFLTILAFHKSHALCMLVHMIYTMILQLCLSLHVLINATCAGMRLY